VRKNSKDEWHLRDCEELSKQIGVHYGLPIDMLSKTGGLRAIANALNESDVARAQIGTVLLGIPDPLSKRVCSRDQMIKLIRDLHWSGMIKWDPDEHPRWPARSADSKGGQFAPKGEGWGAPRIHGELLKLGFTVAQLTVAKYMTTRPVGDGGQCWKTFLRNQAEGGASIDLLTVPTIWFEQLHVCVVLTRARREIAMLTVTGHPTALWLAQQLREAFPWDTAPRILIRDNDAKFGHAFRRRIHEMGIRDHPTSFRSP